MDNAVILKQFEFFYKRNKKILLPLLSLLILVFGYYVVIKGPLDMYFQNVDLMKDLDGRIASADATLASSKQGSDKLTQLSASEKRLLSMSLPSKPDYPSLIVQLTSLARKSGFFVSSIDIEDLGSQSTQENSDKTLGKLSVKMKLVSGGYNELKGMINALQQSVMMNDIYSINFANKSPIYELNLVVYYANPNVTAK